MKRAHDAVSALAASGRVIVLGGIAVVLHGLHRATADVDIWLDPLSNSNTWGAYLSSVAQVHGLSAARVSEQSAQFSVIPFEDIGSIVAQDRFVRLLGCDRPIDVFREPANFTANDFNAAWDRARPLEDGTRLLDEIDLIVTKMQTGRPHDESDARFLQTKIESAYRERLRDCSRDEARALFDRFVTPDLAAFAAAQAADREVRTLARETLAELASNGDPYARNLLEEMEE